MTGSVIDLGDVLMRLSCSCGVRPCVLRGSGRKEAVWVGFSVQKEGVVSMRVFQDLLFHVADLTSRLYELEFELESVRVVLLQVIEKSS